jgi:hypothetical protein
LFFFFALSTNNGPVLMFICELVRWNKEKTEREMGTGQGRRPVRPPPPWQRPELAWRNGDSDCRSANIFISANSETHTSNVSSDFRVAYFSLAIL